MANCCQEKSCELQKMQKSQAKVLWITLSVNALMFFVELIGGIFANSIALTGDSLDMLGDAIAYGSSLYVIHKGASAKAHSAALKGLIMIVSACAVLHQAIWKVLHETPTQAGLMSGVTALALAANIFCLVLLTRHRNDDINMSSVWLCSRNDIIANVSVLAAAGLVSLSGSAWPDIAVGIGISVLFLNSGIKVMKQARQGLKFSAAA